MAQCTAKSKRSGERCRAQAVTGFNVCRHHGGKGGRPPTTGRYSKHLPVRLAGRYEDSLRDPELVSMREQLAILDVILSDRLVALGETSEAALWSDAIAAFAKVRHAFDEGEDVEFALEALERVLENGLGQAAAEDGAREIIQEQAKVARVEAQRLAAIEANITAKEANVLVAALLSAVKTHVQDPLKLRNISAEFVRLAGREVGERLN